ncbi:MAG: TIGR01777 family oxidoreductase [Verrucomicrobiae bacterium]|nr:TIGR01777 family oxidoreductase [Verrucomicrobiae bacterium]
MKIIMSGASGFIGSTARRILTEAGHEVLALVRRPPGQGEATWQPEEGLLDPAIFSGVDGVVHLAGHSAASQNRWTEAHKARIRQSRVQGTRLIAERMVQAGRPPQVLVCASATGYYGDRGEEWLEETSPAGKGFLAEVCQAWEAAAEPARAAGIRVVHLRIGVVLGPQGGALAQMLPWFRWGLGGRLGNGRQWWSWLTLEEMARIIQFALENSALTGPVNAVSPQPVTNAEFTRLLARTLQRPAWAPAPAFFLRALYGEMADELLLASTRVRPAALLRAGYSFQAPELEAALSAMLVRRS